jgi:hypothetical protein
MRRPSPAWVPLLRGIIFSVVVGAAASANAEVLFTFRSSIEGWQGYEGEIRWVPTPSADAEGALEVEVNFTGRGSSENTVESPQLDRDFRQFGKLKVSIRAPSNAPSDLKARLFAKSGDNWNRQDSGWQTLPHDRWTDLTLPIEQLTDPAYVRTIGVQIASSTPFVGSLLIDLIEASATPAGEMPGKVSVTITQITENSRIRGKMTGIPADRVGDYKVLVYVKTDRWYIHPYERGGDGLSWASVNSDGSWQIATVKRQFLADYVAALVVRREYVPPPQVEDLSMIKSVASYQEEGRGRL